MIELTNLSVGHGSKTLIQGITATVDAGELVVLAGRNGAGKSTLIRTMSGLQPALSGQVHFDKQPLARYTSRERAKKVALVLSTPPLWSGLRALDLVQMGAWPAHGKEVLERAKALLVQFGLEAFSDQVMERLSDGERQKVMIARALMQDSPHLLMDEPTAFLDLPSKVEWWSLIAELKTSGKALIVSTHDLHQTERSGLVDRYWMLCKEPQTFQELPGGCSEHELLRAMG